MPRFLLTLLLGCTAFVLAARPPAATAEGASVDSFHNVIEARLNLLLSDELFERSQVGIYVYDLTTDGPLFARGHRQLMRPASTMKVLTAVVALDCLGGDYLYQTKFYATTPLDSVVRGDLVVCGGFDPLFSHDDLRAAIDILKRSGVRRIEGDVVLDLSMKDADLLGWGWCWDDVAVPLTPLLYGGEHRFVEKMTAALTEAGIGLSGNFREGQLPAELVPIVTRSHSIDQVLLPMMKRSDNLFAESLFYQVAALLQRPNASRRDAAALFARFVEKIGLRPSDYQFADGSGLSLYNYLTPELLVATLRYAYRNPSIYDHLSPTLPVMGRDGTLRRRCRGTTAAGNVQAKTGTLEGVSSLAGYAIAPNGHQLCFAIFNQGVLKGSTARAFQDRVCRALTDRLSPSAIMPDTLSPSPDADAADSASEPLPPDAPQLPFSP